MFIGRNLDGTIYGAWTSKQPQDASHQRVEEVPEDHPDLVAFRGRDKDIVPIDLNRELSDLRARIVELEKVK